MSFNTTRAIVDQLAQHVRNKELEGRVFADLTDIEETCRWFLTELDRTGSERLNRDELESFLIEFDVNVLQHLDFHLKSMREALPELLRAVASKEDE